MGRKGTGVENRGSSIRVTFMHEGKEIKRRLTANGRSVPPTPANLRYAERMLAEIREKSRMGALRLSDYFEGEAGPSMPVSEWLAHWLGTQRVTASTKAGYESAIKFWAAAPVVRRGVRAATLGSLGLSEVVLSDLLGALAAKGSLSGKTINNYVSVLREAFSLAVADGMLATNPAASVPRAKYQKPPPDPFTLEEAEAIIAYARKNFPPQVGNLTEAWFFTGMRSSEAFGLKWASVDLRRGEALVHEALVRGQEKASTKTDTARVLKLNSRALAAIERQKAHTFLAGAHVFLHPFYGGPWKDERAFRRSYWERALKALGIRYRRPYNMRHTFATMMLMAGMQVAYCAKQMGHSVEVFLSTYAKWIDGDRNDAEQARLESFIDAQRRQKGAA